MKKLYEVEQMARESFQESIEYGNDTKTVDGLQTLIDALDEPHDQVHETADSCVPVYNYDLLQLAADTPALALDEPECGPAFDGTATPINIIAANVYEALSQDLFEFASELKDEYQEKLDVLEAEEIIKNAFDHEEIFNRDCGLV